MDHNIPFTEDQWWRCVNNLNVMSHFLKLKNWKEYATDESVSHLVLAIEEFENFAYQLYNNFGNQFHHDADARRVCPNPNCHGVFAYFFSDWEYCPKCGTKLLITGNNEKEEEQ